MAVGLYFVTYSAFVGVFVSLVVVSLNVKNLNLFVFVLTIDVTTVVVLCAVNAVLSCTGMNILQFRDKMVSKHNCKQLPFNGIV